MRFETVQQKMVDSNCFQAGLSTLIMVRYVCIYASNFFFIRPLK